MRLDEIPPLQLYSAMRMNFQTTDALHSTVELFKAFADPVRLRLMNLLAEGEVCVCHLHEALELPQSTVSRHLAFLRKRCLVLGRREGLWVHYRLAKPVGELHRLLIGGLGACGETISTLAEDRKRLAGRTCCSG
jgi:ArsR family transcriptional regulator, arsenate/arsenite/antimonite-responsive transcriptional repressor